VESPEIDTELAYQGASHGCVPIVQLRAPIYLLLALASFIIPELLSREPARGKMLCKVFAFAFAAISAANPAFRDFLQSRCRHQA
jgi:hypothetical protein